MPTALQKNLYYTFSFFDLLGKPLTLFECWQNLFRYPDQIPPISILALEKVLNDLPRVQKRYGFYFLKGSQSLVRRRLALHNISQPKWERAKRVTYLLACVPFVRMVAVCNTVAFYTARKNSDIDLLIVIRRGRIWLSRFLVTFAVTLLGLRRHGDKITNRMCLSFYLTDTALNLKNIALRGRGEKQIFDPYLVYWLASIAPLYDDGVSEEFFSQNQWARALLPVYLRYKGVPRRTVNPYFFNRLVKRGQELILGGWVGDLWERLLKMMQIYKMSKNTKSVAREDNTNVIISDRMLKFHEKDARLRYRDALDKKINFVKIYTPPCQSQII